MSKAFSAPTRRLLCGALLSAALVVPVLTAVGASEGLTGPALRKALQARVTQMQWQDAPLRQVLENLGREHRVAVLVDRRVDPDQPLELSVSGVSLGEVLEQIAQSRQLACVLLGPVVYFGPTSEVPKLETALEVARRTVKELPPESRRRWQEPRALLWKRLTVPGELLVRLARDSHVEVQGTEQIPHDLWAAAELPSLPLVDRLGLIAGQFGLMLAIEAPSGRASLVPIPGDVSVVESYPAGKDAQEQVRRWSALVPESQVRLVDGKIEVRGRLQDHRSIAAAERPEKAKAAGPSRSPKGENRYTVPEARGTLGHLLEEYSQQLGLTLKIDREGLARAHISLDQPIRFSVKDATREGLFRALLQPVGCTFRINGETLEVRAK